MYVCMYVCMYACMLQLLFRVFDPCYSNHVKPRAQAPVQSWQSWQSWQPWQPGASWLEIWIFTPLPQMDSWVLYTWAMNEWSELWNARTAIQVDINGNCNINWKSKKYESQFYQQDHEDVWWVQMCWLWMLFGTMIPIDSCPLDGVEHTD